MPNRKKYIVVEHDHDQPTPMSEVGKPTTATQARREADRRRAGLPFGSSTYYTVERADRDQGVTW